MKKFIFLIVILIFSYNVYSQQEENINDRFKWFIGQRSYPHDTLPSYGYYNAYHKKDSLIQAQGYYMSSEIGWQELGPKPYLAGYGWGISSARIAAIEYDPSDLTGIQLVLYPIL